MNKAQAISRINEAKESEDIMVATFPSNICQVCHWPKDVLFVTFFAETLLECCGACALKLQELASICDELLPEQEESLKQKLQKK